MSAVVTAAPLNFRPLHDFVAIRREIPAKKIGSIIIPDSAQEKGQWGTVVAVGPGRVWGSDSKSAAGKFIAPPDVKPGQRVLFGKYAREVEIEGEKLIIAAGDEILAVEENG